jgi:hypothetical protein
MNFDMTAEQRASAIATLAAKAVKAFGVTLESASDVLAQQTDETLAMLLYSPLGLARLFIGRK